MDNDERARMNDERLDSSFIIQHSAFIRVLTTTADEVHNLERVILTQ
jgi:hypothetical protein